MLKVVLLVVLLVIVAVAFFFKTQNFNIPGSDQPQVQLASKSGKENPFSRQYSAGKCEGQGPKTLTHSPMKIEDIGDILPYGIMVDAHVIPTSHGYITPIVFNSPRDSYEVYAPADGYIVNISHRGQFIGDHNNKGRETDEYQMYFEHSCTFYTYFDLLTSLSLELEKAIGGKMSGFAYKQVRIPVKGGQLIGRVGGQTVDFAVWNFEKEPIFFANPESYKGDEDRFYLEDMFLHFKEEVSSQLLSKAKRKVEPRSGRVSYDIDGKLIGNWFRQGSGGSKGPSGEQGKVGGRYWDGHLSISYDYIEPSQIKFSIGNFQGSAAQFSVKDNSPDPSTIGIDTGLIKYELLRNGNHMGTALLQMIEPMKLKLEIFPDKKSDEITGFTSKALIYLR